MEVLYEDNHIIIVNKLPGEIVQGDKTGDTPLVEIVKQWIKEKYAKPGNVFCGVLILCGYLEDNIARILCIITVPNKC